MMRPGGSARALVRAGTLTDADATATFTVPSQRPVYLALQFRSPEIGTGYRVRVRLNPDGSVWPGFSRVADHHETVLLSKASELTVRPGQHLTVQGVVTGSDPVKLYVRAWVGGGPVPAWQQTYVDASAQRITTPGSVRLWAYLSHRTALTTTNVPYAHASASGLTGSPLDVLPAATAGHRTPSVAPRKSPTPRRATTAAPKAHASKSTPAQTARTSARPTSTKTATPPPAKSTPTARATSRPKATPTHSAKPTPRPKATPPAKPKPKPTPTPKITRTGGQPSANNTGVPAGVKLKRHDGTITVTKAGTVIDGLDVHGFIIVKAPNVTIKNSIVRGGRSFGTATGLITNYGHAGLLIEDVTVKAEYPSVYFDGIKGSNFTARRVHVIGNVDSVKIQGNNVTVQDSLLENTVYYRSDPYQHGGHTHNDNIQILNGTNITIAHNTIRGSTNFAVLAGAEHGNVQVVVTHNWLDGGYCTVKLANLHGWSETAVVTDNRFGPHRTVRSCAFTAYPTVHLTSSGNTFVATGSTVPIVRVKS